MRDVSGHWVRLRVGEVVMKTIDDIVRDIVTNDELRRAEHEMFVMRRDLAVTLIQEQLDKLPDDSERINVLEAVLKNRCRKCLDYDPSGNFWCCYESRGG